MSNIHYANNNIKKKKILIIITIIIKLISDIKITHRTDTFMATHIKKKVICIYV